MKRILILLFTIISLVCSGQDVSPRGPVIGLLGHPLPLWSSFSNGDVITYQSGSWVASPASAGFNILLTTGTWPASASGSTLTIPSTIPWGNISSAPNFLTAANNLSDVGNTSIARTNLGLQIGLNVEAWSANLDKWATLDAAAKATKFTVNSPLTYSSNILGTNSNLVHWGAIDTASKQKTLKLVVSGSSGSSTLAGGVLTIPTYTLAGLGGIGLTSLSATSPLSYNNSTGAFSIQTASGSQAGAITSTDWNTFNGKTNLTSFSGTSPVTYNNSTGAIGIGTIGISNGGTGQTTQQTCINALTGTQSSGKYLRSDGTNATLSTIQIGDVPTLNQNTTGTAANVTATSNSTITTLSALSLPASQLTGYTPTQWTTQSPGIYYPNTALIGSSTNPSTVTTLTTVETSTNTLRGASFYQFNGGTNSSEINALKARGTAGSPSAITTADVVSDFKSWAHDGTQFTNCGSAKWTSTGTISSGIVPSVFTLGTMNASGTLTTGLTIDQNQNATIAGTTTSTGTLFANAHNTTGAGLTITQPNVTGVTQSSYTTNIYNGLGTGLGEPGNIAMWFPIGTTTTTSTAQAYPSTPLILGASNGTNPYYGMFFGVAANAVLTSTQGVAFNGLNTIITPGSGGSVFLTGGTTQTGNILVNGAMVATSNVITGGAFIGPTSGDLTVNPGPVATSNAGGHNLNLLGGIGEGTGAATKVNLGGSVPTTSGATVQTTANFYTGSTTTGNNLISNGATVTPLTIQGFGTGGSYTGTANLANFNTFNGTTATTVSSIDKNGNHYAPNFVCNSGTPTIVAGAGAGTSPTISISGNNESVAITLTVGTLPSSASVIATVTMANSFAYSTTTTPVFSAANATAATLSGTSMIYMAGASTTTFTLNSGTVALGAGTYIWNVQIEGN